MQDKMRILYCDEAIVVIEKASGFLSVPGKGPENLDSVSHRITREFPESIPQPAVHRLDMDTSGIMVLALTKDAHRNLSIQFQERQTEKHYIAMLEGIVNSEAGRIELPFRLDIDNRPYQIYDPVHGKTGITEWRLIAIENGCSRIHFTPITGRTHQLRVHSAHEKGLGIPIVGDPLYGNGDGPGKMKLHAFSLTLKHPLNDELMVFEIPPKW